LQECDLSVVPHNESSRAAHIAKDIDNSGARNQDFVARRQLHIDAMAQLRSKKRSLLLDTMIPASSTIERVSAERAPVAAFAPKTAAARSFAALWQETEAALYGKGTERPGATRGDQARRR